MKTHDLTRRRFLGTTLAAATLALVESPFRTFARAAHVAQGSRLATLPTMSDAFGFAPVKIARNRIIRTVVGLRPFREEGFVVGAERLGNTLLVHNYGHGGAGVTLSWGTSSMAVELARQHLPGTTSRRRNRSRRYAVLGCGVMGLSTARLVQSRLLGKGEVVTIYARAIPPNTTSNIAGALWLPTSSYNSESASPKFLDQFRQASLLSNRAFQEMVGPDYGVSWTDAYELISLEASLDRELIGGNELYPQIETYRNREQSFGFPFVRKYSTMLIEPNTYLRALLRDFYVAGGKVVVKELKSREEVARLSEQVVFNCTGLGARDLFGDQKLRPVRGQLEVLLPQPEIDYSYLHGSSYMFPRRDGIILGGTFDHDDWSLEPDRGQTTEILEANASIVKRLTGVSPG